MGMRNLLLLGVGITAAQAASHPFNFTLTAVDPLLRYEPIGNRTADTKGGTDPSNAPTGAASQTAKGWELSYSGVDIPAANVTFYTLGEGTPKRSTNSPDATVTVNWTGTGIWFKGNATDAADFQVTVDGHPTLVNSAKGVLGGVADLPYVVHTAVLKVNSGTVDVLGATITTNVEAEDSDTEDLSTTEISTVAGADKKLNPVFQATPGAGGENWEGRWDWAGTSWDHVGTTGQNAALSYSVPANTTFLALYGGTSGWNGDYQVTFTPNLSYNDHNSRGSEYSTWRGEDVVLWAGPLDPTQKYDMKLQTLLDNWWIDVSKVKVWSALPDNSSAPQKKSTPIGAIVGGVVGGLALIGLLLLAFLLIRRRKNRPSESHIDILDDDYVYPTPYHTGQNAGNRKPGLETEYIGRPQTLERTETDLSTPGQENAFLLDYSQSRSQTGTSSSGSASHTQSGRPLTVVGGIGSGIKQAGGPRPQPREITRQETDGGTIVNLVPPSYDPSWAQPGNTTTT